MSFGRFERSPGPRPMSEINMTPLIDVMLVLLVIFIITAPLLASSIRLDLPKTDAARAGDAPKSVLVVVDKSGQAFLSDRPLDLAELATQLLQVATTCSGTKVQLRAAAAVPYGGIVAVMGAAQKAGLNRSGFVADVPPRATAMPQP
jgi:biopolymer transport protein TolR